MYNIKLRNIKGITEMDFPFPTRKGVYVLTGTNGSGKTSLLIALCRLGDGRAFSYFKTTTGNLGGLRIDTYANASITYCVGGTSVTYQRTGVRWVPQPRKNSDLLTKFPFTNTLFVSTTGGRFFSQELFNLNPRCSFNVVAADMVSAMNNILGTNKFANLKFITVKNKKGRQQRLRRDNKLYVVKSGTTIYSEQNFSLGEKLLLNTLDLLQDIAPKTLLLIDEVELALHPIAQVKFYDFLKQQAEEKNLAVIISTHSSSLIKHADNRFFLEKDEGGVVNIRQNCYPSYILRGVSGLEDRRPDFIFFVEDAMASKYLDLVLRKFLNDTQRNRLDCKVVPAGPFDQVIRLLQAFPSLCFEKNKIQAFLDKDAEDEFDRLSAKGNARTNAENQRFELFVRNRENITYLKITPELGVWQWVTRNAQLLRDFFDQAYGVQSFDIVAVVDDVNLEEPMSNPNNLRKWAKGCFENFKGKITSLNPNITPDKVVDCMLECYVNYNYNLNELKRKLCPILNR